MRKFGLLTAALVAAATCAPANATSFTAQDYARAKAAIKALETTNLISLGNAQLQSDVEGKAYVGGDLTGGGTIGIGRNGKSALPFALARTLTVGGNMSANINVNNGIGLSSIELAIGGDKTGSLSLNNGSAPATVLVGGNFDNQSFNPNSSKRARYGGNATNVQSQDVPYLTQDTTLKAGGTADLKAGILRETNALTTQLSTLSQILGALTPNATLTTSNLNAVPFNFSGTTGNYAVVDINASLLNNAGAFLPETFANQNNGKTLIVNVSGSTVNFNMDFSGAQNGAWDNLQQNIIWNFTDATTITVNRAIYGSILAPKATISGNSPMNGSVAVKVFQANGEVHLGTFAGNTGFIVTVPPHGGGGGGGPTDGVPEPASWMTMLAGFGIIGSLIRRQRQRERLAAA
jgi:choice-of-anchor A domain-containing protein